MTKWLKALGIFALVGCLVWSEAAFAFRGGGFRGGGFRGGGFHGAGVRAGGFHGGGALAGRWGGARPGWGAGRWAGGRYGRYGYGAGWGLAGAAALATAPYWSGNYNASYNCGAYAYYSPGYGCVPYQQ